MTKKCSGNYNFNLISVCNILGLFPHELVNKLKSLYKDFFVNAEFKESIISWVFTKMIEESEFDEILENVFENLKIYEFSTLQKIDFIYLVAKECASGSIENML